MTIDRGAPTAGLRGNRKLGVVAGRIRPPASEGSRLLVVFGVLLLSVSAPGALHAQSARSLVEEGNRLYEEGRFQEAHEKYMEAMTDAPDSPVIPFNAGNALYQDADYRRAMEAYEQAIASGDPELASDAWYNLGNALYRQQQLAPSLEAYKQALRLDPADIDAKHNLERVLQQMQQQQQPDSQQDGQQDEEPQERREPQRDQQPRQDQQQGQQQGGPQEQEGDQAGGPPPPDEPGGGEDPSQSPQSDQPPDGPPEGEAEAQPRPGEMTEEEARRLLDAIEEDPDDVNRRQATAQGRRPSKPW